MPLTFQLPEGYGYVVLVALGVIPVLSFMQGTIVSGYRKPAGVPYPNFYATPQQIKENRQAYKFNCAQRAHGQLLENMSQMMMSMMVAGLRFPLVTAGLGAAWVAFRVLFTYGYIASEKPSGNGRYLGSGFWLMQAGVWGMCTYTALSMV